jgi:hypothetical protein
VTGAYVHRQLGNRDEALRYYRLASEHLEVLKDDAYGRSVREGTMQALTELLAELGETRNGVDPASSG